MKPEDANWAAPKDDVLSSHRSYLSAPLLL